MGTASIAPAVGSDTGRWELHKLAAEGVRRACLAGLIAFPCCFLSDVFLRRAAGIGDSLTRAALRIGVLTLLILVGWLHAQRQGARMAHPFALGTVYLWLVHLFAALAAAPTGGPSSPYTYGILAAGLIWCLLMPGGARYAATPLLGGAVLFDAVMLYMMPQPRPFALTAAVGVFQLIALTVTIICSELFERSRCALALASITDGLTGLLNRRYLFQRLHELAALRRRDLPVGAIMIDIDHFKRINDTHGHLVGDEAIRLVARMAGAAVRAGSDLCGRYGGEEFLLVLPGASADVARAVAERLRQQIADTPLLVNGARLNLTVSAGVASVAPGEQPFDPERLVRQADEALLFAKRAGRDRVECAAAAAE